MSSLSSSLVLVSLLQIQVWDTAGQERFRTITQSYYRSAHGAIIAYDITRHATFDSVSHWISEVELYGASNVTLVLIGEKLTVQSLDCFDVNTVNLLVSWSRQQMRPGGGTPGHI